MISEHKREKLREANRRSFAKHGDRVRKLAREAYHQKKNHIQERRKAWRDKNKEKLIIHRKKKRVANINKVLAYEKKWRTDNLEKRREYCRERYASNSQKAAAYAKTWRKNNPEKSKRSYTNSRIKSKYGITLDQYNAMAAAQNNKCAACETHGKLHLDHCHSSGKLRGMLCSKCNLGLGMVGDSPSRLRALASYVEKSRD